MNGETGPAGGRAKDLAPLFRPRSVAIVGCSPVASGKLGSWPLRNLLVQGAEVDIWPVNPTRTEIDGLRCYASLAEVPGAPDVVLVMVPAAEALGVLREAESLGAGSAIVFGAGFGETASGRALEVELAELARSTAMPICGPNTDGVINVVEGIPCGFPPYAAITPRPVGDVGVVSQSGALVSSLVMRLVRNRLGLSYSCAIGNAVDLGVADYVGYLAVDARTASILVYVEGIGDARAFVAAARPAVEAGKLVAVLKGGRSEVGSAAARSHTGAMVGAYDAFAALCAANGIVTVDSVEEFASVPALWGPASRVAPARRRRLGVVSGSGAVGGHLVDKAAEHGLEVPELGAATVGRLGARFRFTTPRNPIDLTGQVVHDPELHVEVLDALGADPGVGMMVSGSLYGPEEICDRLKRELVEAQETIPVVVYSAEGTDAAEEPILAAGGVPVMASADVLMGGLAKVFDALDTLDARARVPAEAMPGSPERVGAAEALLAAAPAGEPVPLGVAWSLLEAYGLAVVPLAPVAGADEAVAAAAGAAGPVAMKVDSPEVLHKSDRGLVALGVAGEGAVRRAYEALVAAAVAAGSGGTGIVVQPMADPGVELLVGGRSDPEVGPVVVVGAGGIHAEVLDDRVVLVAPATAEQVRAALRRLRVAAMLAGARGQPPAEVESLVAFVVRFSELVAELAHLLGEVELNPVIAGPAGAVAVDALAVRAAGAAGAAEVEHHEGPEPGSREP